MEWNVGTVRELADAAKDARLRQHRTQAEVAVRARVSRQWLVAFESGAAGRSEVGRVLAVLNALGLRIIASDQPLTELMERAIDYIRWRAPLYPKEFAEPLGITEEDSIALMRQLADRGLVERLPRRKLDVYVLSAEGLAVRERSKKPTNGSEAG